MTAQTVKGIRNRLAVLTLHVRAVRLRVLSALGVIQAGSGLQVGSGVELRVYGELILGHRVRLDRNCSLQVSPGARLVIGDDSYVGQGTVIAAAEQICIGRHVLIAEHCSIRDGDHQIDGGARRVEARMNTRPIALADDVWVGAGVRVLKGSTVERAAVLAANAVVNGHIEAASIAAGAPARIIRRLGV